MKLQLLYVFVLAAPLLVHLLSRETKVTRVDTEPAAATAEAQPTPSRPAAAKPATAPAAQPVAKPAPATKTQIPAAHAFTFM
ncbi:hypothetical protein [Opitutus terrae]|uniref:Uncharacterized protein n=1 Tax=Opitutus terrae (strain DSM 11246 / JCM 15787 / PB90-1) TaxID=452637 RepID=B1ZWJ1_OPITP|nr:hypothetical protein [Opitutus terrae]ACB73315.1 hypothetical protein Oter_0023 [Opitutus terrae PB90-1]